MKDCICGKAPKLCKGFVMEYYKETPTQYVLCQCGLRTEGVGSAEAEIALWNKIMLNHQKNMGGE